MHDDVVVWPHEGSLKLRQEIPAENLFRVFDRNYSSDFSVNAFYEMCERLKLKKHRVVMLSHEISAFEWDKNCEKLALWYLRQFWERPECRENMPLFLIFLNIIYPISKLYSRTEILIWEYLRKKRIRKTARLLAAELKDCCFLFDELKRIDIKHVKAWFAQHRIDIYLGFRSFNIIFHKLKKQ